MDLSKVEDTAWDLRNEVIKPPLDPPPVDNPTLRVHLDTPLAGTSTLEKPGDRIGRYKLLEPLGKGGCGIVYLAEQEEPVRRRVALKVIKVGMDTEQVIARFEAERQALAMMDHPNIAKVFDAGQTDSGRPYFVMELVRGVPITHYCSHEKLPASRRLQLFVQVCHAIQHAHQKGIIHRDIKPSNVLVAFQDGAPVPKVIDFGIAKATITPLTEKNIYTAVEQFVGTPAYMSPEQAEMSSMDIDTRSDVYSLGVLLYELLTSFTPFDAKKLLAAGFDEVRRHMRVEEPPRPSTRLSTLQKPELIATAAGFQTDALKLISVLRGDLDWIVMRCLEKDRTRRYETANGLAMDLNRFLASEPVMARPPSRWYRLQKMARRNKVSFAAVTAVFLAMAVGLGIAVFGLSSAWRDRNKAVQAATSEASERIRAQEAETSAIAAAALAQEQTRIAAKNAEESRTRLVRFQVANGLRMIEENNYFGSLTWFVGALRTDQETPAAELDRIRLAAVLRHSPKLLQIWFHGARVAQSAFSPDGRFVVTVSDDLNVRVWNALTGDPVTPPMQHTHSLLAVSFDPTGRFILSAAADETARIWDATTGKPTIAPIKHGGHVNDASFDHSGTRVLTICSDGTARVWDAATGDPATPPLRHPNILWQGAFSPNGKEVITACEDGAARIWDVTSGELRLASLRHGAAVRRAVYSPDGARILTSSIDGTARIWIAATGEPLSPPMQHHGGIEFCAFSPDGSRVVTASHDTTARIWNGHNGAALSPPLRHTHAVNHAAFSPDGKTVVTASWDHTARLWNSENGQPVGPSLRHLQQVSHVQFNRNGTRLLTSGNDGLVQMWDLSTEGALRFGVSTTSNRTGANEQSPASAQLPETLFASFSPDGSRFLTVSPDGTGQLWNSTDGSPVCPPFRHRDSIHFGAFSHDGRLVATASQDGTAVLWHTDTGAQAIPPLQHPQGVLAVSFSPDSRTVATADTEGSARIWDSRTGQLIASPLVHKARIRRLVFSADGKRLATASFDSSARVWDAATGEPVTGPLMHASEVWDVNFSPDGTRLVTACADASDAAHEAQIWDAVRGEKVSPPLKHSDGVRAASFDRTGKYVVTASEDSTARIWLAETGELSAVLRNRYHANSAVFSPDARLVATGSGDGCVRLWDALTGELLGPPLGPRSPMGHLDFGPDSRSLLAPSIDGYAYLFDIASEERSLPELTLLAEILSKDRINPNGNLEPLETPALRDKWAALTKRPVEPRAVPPVSNSKPFHISQILPRPKDLSPNLIDLTAHFNAGLEESWHGNSGNDLAELLPAGLKTFGGTQFDVRGIVQLKSPMFNADLGLRFPATIRGIKVDWLCKSVRFLHAAGWGNGPEGTHVATYLLHFEDGSHTEFPLKLGNDLSDWHFNPRARATPKNSQVVWEGSNAESRGLGNRLQLFMSTWPNPGPGQKLLAIDYISAMNEPAAFLLAITVEN